MALIGEIRKHSWLLLVVVAVAMLAFILGDMFKNQGRSYEEKPMASVGDFEITKSELDIEISKELGKYETFFNKRLEQISQQTQDQNTLIYYRDMFAEQLENIKKDLDENYIGRYMGKKLYDQQFDKIGLQVSSNELNDLLQGNNVMASVYEQNQLFLDQNKRFSKDTLKKYIARYYQDPAQKFYMTNFIEKPIEEQRKRDKYNTLISKGLYVTNLEAKESFEEKNNKVAFDYVFQNYNAIPDSLIKVNEEELKAFYAKHKTEKKYKQKDEVDLQYIEFNVLPSKEDTADLMSSFNRIAASFKEAKNDTTFVARQGGRIGGNFLMASDFGAMDSIILNSDTGTVVGPFIQRDSIKLIKIMEKSKKSYSNVRHILLGFDKYGKDMKVLDSIAENLIGVLEKGGNFNQLVTQYSTDFGSVEKGGVYENVNYQTTFVPEFLDASLYNEVGSFEAVPTQFGVHIINIMNRRLVDTTLFKVATISERIAPSQTTLKLYEQKAVEFINKFEEQSVSDTTFVRIARQSGLIAKPINDIAIEQRTIIGMENPFDLIKWSFSEAQLGELSVPFEVGEKFVVAQLLSKREEGEPTLETAKVTMLDDFIKEKKGEEYAARMKGTDLTDIANGLGLQVQNVASISYDQINIQGAGNEPKVIGKIFGLTEGQVSNPIAGDNGIYVVQVKSKIPGAEAPGNFTAEKQMMERILRGRAPNEVQSALIEKYDVKDNRKKLEILGYN